MALFPAYGTNNISRSPENEDGTNRYNWLQNASFASHHLNVLTSVSNDLLFKDETKDKESGEPNKDGKPKESCEKLIVCEDRKHHHKHKKDSKHKHKRRARSRSSSRSNSPALETLIQQNKATGNSKKIFIEDVGLNPEHAFRVDRKSDHNILVFSAFAHPHIAKYIRRLPCLGDSSKPNKSFRKVTSTSANRYHAFYKLYSDDSNVVDMSRPKTKEISAEFKRAFHDMYIPIHLSPNDHSNSSSVINQVEMRTSDNPLGVYDSSTCLYYEGKGVRQEVPHDAAPHLSENIYKETHEQYPIRLTTEFNKYLRDNPHDVKRWLEFVKFQNESMDSAQISDFTITAKHEKITEAVILEKKIAILDKAIESNPKSVELLAYKYDLCKDLWDTDKLMSEWKRILFVHPNNTWLWQQYLKFVQTRFSAFTATKFVKLYKKCFDMLKKIHEGSFQSHKPLPGMEENMLDIFSNYCRVLYQSGYHERAIANFQALIEFNFFAPEQLQRYIRLDDWLAFFEPFWDSGNPRFGEAQAIGWCSAMKNKETHSTTLQNLETEHEESVMNSSNPKWKNWLNLEHFRENHHWLPWRATDMDDECEDPERMVLFDDISPSLFLIKSDYSKFILLVRFLEMLGIQITPHYQSTCRFLNCHNPGYITDSSEILDGSRHFKWRFYMSDRTDNMFSLEPLCSKTDNLCNFANQVFEQSCKVLQEPYKKALALLWINHHCNKLRLTNLKMVKGQLKEPKRLIKNMLKLEENRNDLVLWTLYAKLEWQCKNYAEARKIFNLALATHSQVYGDWSKMDNRQKSALCNVYKTYAELELGYNTFSNENGNETTDGPTRGLSILVNLGCDAKYIPYSNSEAKLPPSLILKARLQYRTLFTDLMNSYSEVLEGENFQLQDWLNDRHVLLDWTVCYAFFEYLTEGLQGANSIFDNALLFFKSKFSRDSFHDRSPPASEIRYLSYCEFLYMHYIQLHVYHSNTCASAPLGILRKVLDEALKLFPENQHFNNLFLDMEAKSCLTRRVRLHYDAQLKASSLPRSTSAVFAIVAELERQNNLIDSLTEASHIKTYESFSSLRVETGIVHRLRALFEKIVNHPNHRHCVLTWRLYLKFEAMQFNPKNAKAVFYRALQQCPWAKVLYLDAVQHFPEDIQEINDIVTEKEIRVRTPLEEVELLMETNDNQEEIVT